MDELKLPATFFIVTGDITGSRYKGGFIGRPVEEILRESATVPISKDNFFERATAVRYLGYEGAMAYHTRAGDMFELGKFDEAHKHIAEAYASVRNGQLKRLPSADIPDNPTVDVSWDELKALAGRGYEFGSHSVTHPQPAICDDPNLRYEIEKSREEILYHLGSRHTFSCELPHGSENPRVMALGLKVYPALRNRMPADYLEEINRWSKKDPLTSGREYVQWQRGPKTKTTVPEMTGWLDTCITRDNIWLVLTFHGIDGIGYEPKTGADVRAFFEYLNLHRSDVWVATFGDATKYIRERMNATVQTKTEGEKILVNVKHKLDAGLYDLPLTLKTYVPEEWKRARLSQPGRTPLLETRTDEHGRYVLYDILPNAGPAELTHGLASIPN
jgi:peptidoglycan/xylan/chitin deacetylase (PgdA/CDA1 family)